MNEPGLGAIWVYLSTSPLVGLTATLVAYGLSYRLYVRLGHHPLLNPVLVAVVLLIAFLLATQTPYDAYFAGAQYVHFLLGPATVALALPLYRQIAKLRRQWFAIALALLGGIIVGAGSSVAIARLFGASLLTQLSLAPKSVTAPVAMGIAERIGGLPSLTAVLVVITGVIGAVIGTKLFDLLGIRDDGIRGVAMGITAHGIGTARAFQVSPEMGAFAGLAMALSAGASAILLPVLIGWLTGP